MRKLIATVSVLAVILLAAAAYAQTRCGSNLCIGSSSTSLIVQGPMTIAGATTKTTCTMNGASPAVCTATVTAGSTCYCTMVGATAAIAAGGCAVGLSGTTLTATTVNASTAVANILCF
jgi:hypothetical protein